MSRSWYVYALADPRDGSVFYVGKGTGKRAAAHERSVVNGHCRSQKDWKIATIVAGGFRTEVRMLAAFEDERLAYAFEGAAIQELRSRLLNIKGGDRRTVPSMSLRMRARVRAVALLASVIPLEVWERMRRRTEKERQLRQYVIDSLEQVAAA